MGGMIDNRRVGKSPGGIKSKLQRGKPEKTWQDGSMADGMKKANESHWKRSGDSLTPRKA